MSDETSYYMSDVVRFAASDSLSLAISQALSTYHLTSSQHVDWIYRFVHATKTYDGSSYVYFISAASTNLVKIGRSINPRHRLSRLQLLSPVSLSFIGLVRGGTEVEGLLHERFAYLKSHGEWFHATAEMRGFVQAVDIAGRVSAGGAA